MELKEKISGLQIRWLGQKQRWWWSTSDTG